MTDANENTATLASIAARCILYTILMAAIALLPALDIANNPFDQEILFAEFSFVQIAQDLILILGILVSGYLVYNKVLPQLSLLFVSLLACALVREQDAFFDVIADGLWQALIALLAIAIVYQLVKQKEALKTQVAWLGNQFCLGLMLAGFVVIMGFARMFGRGEMWQQIMGDRYTKTIKYFAEESIELKGYVILVIGIIEFGIAATRRFRRSNVSLAVDH